MASLTRSRMASPVSIDVRKSRSTDGRKPLRPLRSSATASPPPNQKPSAMIGEYADAATHSHRTGKTRRRVHCIIQREFHLRELSAPLRWLIHTNTAKHIFQNTVDPFGLTIRLRMIRCRHIQSSSHQPKEMLPEGRNETRVPITHKRLRESMMSKHMINEELGRLRSRNTSANHH